MAIKFPWTKTEIERTLDHEPNQRQIDGGMAWGLLEDLKERNPEAAAKMLKQWKQEAENAS